jgi:hypothetical protein
MVSDADAAITGHAIDAGIRYIASHREIEDVLLSGGDPLILSDRKLDAILARLRAEAPHVRLLRIGSRLPARLPTRNTDELCELLSRHNVRMVNIHINHPKEITPLLVGRLAMLRRAGVMFGNQSVLLRGVNDSVAIERELRMRLVEIGVRPSYVYSNDSAHGNWQFTVPLAEMTEIARGLRGWISGPAVPTFVVDGTGGLGKMPVLPAYVMQDGETGEVWATNYEGQRSRQRNLPQIPWRAAAYAAGSWVYAGAPRRSRRHRRRAVPWATSPGRGQAPPVQRRLAQLILQHWQGSYRSLQGTLHGLRLSDWDRQHLHENYSLGKQRTVRNNIVHCVMAEFWAHGSAIRNARAAFAGVEHDGSRPVDAVWKKYGQPPANFGTVADLLQTWELRHNELLEELAGVTDAELDIERSWWEESGVSVRFRLNRLGWHLQDHVAVLETICERIGRVRTETERLAVRIFTALGTAEGAMIGLPSDEKRDLFSGAVEVLRRKGDELQALYARFWDDAQLADSHACSQ